MSTTPRELSAAETVEQVLLYVEAALELARAAGEAAVAEQLAELHARLLREGLRPAPDHALF